MPNTQPYGYIEIHELSGKEKYALFRTPTAVRVFRGPWANRQDFINLLLPGSFEVDGEVFFNDPISYPDLPGLIATSVDVEGKGKSFCDGVDGSIRYEDALLTVNYETVFFQTNPPNPPGGTPTFPILQYVVVTGEISTQVFTFQKEELSFPDNEPVLKEAQKIQSIINFTVKILFHPKPRWAEAFNFAGSVNFDKFTIPKINQTFPGDTILYSGVTFNEKAAEFRSTIYELEYKFAYKKEPNWNQGFNRKGDIKDISLLNNNLNYTRVNLNELFQTIKKINP